ncbi:type I glyceraldehyde-3-phosphate dehydrogenase [Halocola ammonii]
MKKIKVGINGFGRIGRMTARLILQSNDLELVAINDTAELESMAHLFKYDSIHGQWKGAIEVDYEKSVLRLNGKPIQYSREKNPGDISWDRAGASIVVECTGLFKSASKVRPHLSESVKKVIVSAPPEDNSMPTVVLGVNDEVIDSNLEIISNASCTTNNAAPLLQLVDELCEIESCYITTVHSFTGDQRLHDAPHKDLRRARAATQSIVPTTTGAAKALTRVFPHLNEVIGGCGIRVPVPDGSLTDLTCSVKNTLSVAEINEAFKEASNGRYRGIVEYTEDPVVSVDVLGNSHSCLFDAQLTSVIGKMVKVVGWYDNEIGYSNRMVDLIRKFHNA